MKPLVFHFDFVSPYAWLAFERLPQVLQGCSYAVEYRPLLFAGLLQHLLARDDGPAAIRSAAGRLMPHTEGGRKRRRRKCVRCGKWHDSARGAWRCKCEPVAAK